MSSRRFRPLVRVEVKIDNSEWRPAKLGEGRSNPVAWTFWEYDWTNPQPGEHTVVSRGIDATGYTQPAADAPEI